MKRLTLLNFFFLGNIIIDEMKIPVGLSLDRNSLEVIGVVDIGKFTPNSEKNKRGDHVLEVLFQPFRGNWVQSLGVFLTRSNCKGDILAKIVLETVALSENASLLVDGVVTDGAPWNRVMWSHFGVSEETCSSQHPVREDCQLFFFSDWSHLIKCARNLMSPELPTRLKIPSKKGQTGKRKMPKELN